MNYKSNIESVRVCIAVSFLLPISRRPEVKLLIGLKGPDILPKYFALLDETPEETQ